MLSGDVRAWKIVSSMRFWVRVLVLVVAFLGFLGSQPQTEAADVSQRLLTTHVLRVNFLKNGRYHTILLKTLQPLSPIKKSTENQGLKEYYNHLQLEVSSHFELLALIDLAGHLMMACHFGKQTVGSLLVMIMYHPSFFASYFWKAMHTDFILHVLMSSQLIRWETNSVHKHSTLHGGMTVTSAASMFALEANWEQLLPLAFTTSLLAPTRGLPMMMHWTGHFSWACSQLLILSVANKSVSKTQSLHWYFSKNAWDRNAKQVLESLTIANISQSHHVVISHNSHQGCVASSSPRETWKAVWLWST